MDKKNEKIDGSLVDTVINNMDVMTWDRIAELAIQNAKNNSKFISAGLSIADLKKCQIGLGDAAIIVAAGPSVSRQNPASILKSYSFNGAIIATDSGLGHCLRNDIIPDLVVSLDPHPTRIVRWFGDPQLDASTIEQDDYYRRQDLDPMFSNEIEANNQIMELMSKYSKDIPIALSTSTSAAVVERVLSAGMTIYWWNPMLDDPDQSDSVTRKMMKENGLPALNAGGNVGSASWMIASEVLNKQRVALTGMDFSYYDNTSLKATQYYNEVVDLVGIDKIEELFSRIYNPYTESWFVSDPAYQWYNKCLLEMVTDSDTATYNCTEGGILFGNGIEFIPLVDFLSMLNFKIS
jgi:hypothetical protein